MFNPVRSVLTAVIAFLALPLACALAADSSTTSAPADKPLRDMNTDRPDKTNAPQTVDVGHVQFEVGIADYVYYRDKFRTDNARDDLFMFGQVLARVGVLNNVEATIGTNGYDYSRVTDFNAGSSVRQNSVGDLTLGAKLNLFGNDTEDKPWATALGVESQFKIPTARRDVGNGHFEATVGVPFVVSLPGGFHLGAEAFVSDQRNSANTASQIGWQNSAALDRVVIDKLDVYIEYWSSVTQHGEAQQTLDVGAVYQLTDSLVLDTGLNFGLNKATSNFESTVGFSVRF